MAIEQVGSGPHEWRMHRPIGDWPMVGMQDKPSGEKVVSIQFEQYMAVHSEEENTDNLAELYLTLEQSKSVALQLLLHVASVEGGTTLEVLERYRAGINARPASLTHECKAGV
jgi:hypothetical protein